MTAPAVGVNVLLERGYKQGDVVDELAAHGLVVRRVLRRLNVVSGNVAPDRLKELSEVAGVRAVEVDRATSAADIRSDGLKPG
jgi:BioD-like phosphotransacetylase family protein